MTANSLLPALSLTGITVVIGFKFLDYFWSRTQNPIPSVKFLCFRRLVGALFYWVVPFFLFHALDLKLTLHDIGLNFEFTPASVALSLAVICVFLGLGFYAPQKCTNSSELNKIPTNEFPKSYWIAWGLYLFSYETFYRGILFLPLVNENSLLNAIIVSSFFYFVAHIGDPPAEILGALIMAPIFIGISLLSKSIYLAFLIHLSIPVLIEYFSNQENKRRHSHDSRN